MPENGPTPPNEEVSTISLDEEEAERRYLAEPTTELSPDKIFDRRWAQTVLDRALERLRLEYAGTSRAELFDALNAFVTGDTEAGDYPLVAAQLHMTSGAVAVAVHRMRQRYRELVRAEVLPTVASSADADKEMGHLFAALSG
jgi:RNA polymerase sigma-70 factor (ECF subfamily)